MTKPKNRELVRIPWTLEDDKLLKKLLDQRWSRQRIADRLNRTRAAILSRCRNKGWTTPAVRWTVEELCLVRELREQGMSNKDIGRCFSRTPKAIQNVCEKQGWTQKPARSWKKKDDWILLDRLPLRELDRIADEFDRTVPAICQRATKLGCRWKDQRWSFIRAAQVLGVTYQTVHRYWKRINDRKRRLTEKGVRELAQAILNNPHTNIKNSKRLRAVVRGEWDAIEVYPQKKHKWSIEEIELLLEWCIKSRLETGKPDFVGIAAKLSRKVNAVKCKYHKLTKNL